jgi:hypothetical protein
MSEERKKKIRIPGESPIVEAGVIPLTFPLKKMDNKLRETDNQNRRSS